MKRIDLKNTHTRNLIGVIMLFLVIRLMLAWMTLGFESGDYEVYLDNWYTEIQNNGGLAALGEQVGNYGILYQFMIGLMTYMPVSALSSYKMLSLLFDIVMALACGAMVRLVLHERPVEQQTLGFAAAYITALLLPTAIYDSSVWAQCDSIYTSFVVLALLCLCKERYALTFILLGIAFSFKLQTSLIVPVFLLIAFMRRKLHYLPLAAVSWYATCIPGFLAGRSLLSPLTIYEEQTVTYSSMFANFPSFWVLIGGDYSEFSDVAIVYTVAILAVYMMYFLYRYQGHESEITAYQIVQMACLLAWTCVEFLPNMHERYSYAVEILLVILICVNRKYLPCLVLEEVMVLLRYRLYLFEGAEVSDAEAVVYLCAYVLFVVLTFYKQKSRPRRLSTE